MFTGHSQSLGDALLLIQQTKPAFWKCIDPDPGSAQAASGATKLIIRHYGPWDNGEPSVVTPAAFVAACQSQGWWPFAWAVETPNEPHPGDPGWMAEACRLIEGAGKVCVVGNWGTGWDGFYVPGATYYGAHEYGVPQILSQAPWHALRYRSWFPGILQQNPQAKLIFTEVGVTQAVTGGKDIGWKTVGTAQEYADGLRAYEAELAKDPYVLGAAIYQFGGHDDWKTFEGLKEPVLEQLIGGVLAAPLQPPAPQPAILHAPADHQPVAEVSPVSEYGFKGLFDGFDGLAAKKGYAIVGRPLHEARYLGSDYCYQFTDKGKLEAVKTDDGSWQSFFTPFQ